MLTISKSQLEIMTRHNVADRLRAHLLVHTQHPILTEVLEDRSSLDAFWTPLQSRLDGEPEYEQAVRMTFAVACWVAGRDQEAEAAQAELKDEPEIAMKSNWAGWGVLRFSVLDL